MDLFWCDWGMHMHIAICVQVKYFHDNGTFTSDNFYDAVHIQIDYVWNMDTIDGY